jgi:hypothetical protein
MTDKQIQAVKDRLNEKYYGNKPYFPDNLKQPITKEDETLYKELSCREMINSCLIYGSDPFRKITKWWYGHGHCERSYMSDYEDKLGVERVRQLYEEQKFDISQAKVHHNVHTDSEGLSYNSITWADEL